MIGKQLERNEMSAALWEPEYELEEQVILNFISFLRGSLGWDSKKIQQDEMNPYFNQTFDKIGHVLLMDKLENSMAARFTCQRSKETQTEDLTWAQCLATIELVLGQEVGRGLVQWG